MKLIQLPNVHSQATHVLKGIGCMHSLTKEVVPRKAHVQAPMLVPTEIVDVDSESESEVMKFAPNAKPVVTPTRKVKRSHKAEVFQANSFRWFRATKSITTPSKALQSGNVVTANTKTSLQTEMIKGETLKRQCQCKVGNFERFQYA
jgi:hypothetical protein